MDIQTIFNNIQTADNIQTIIDTLKKATVLEYVSETLEIQYDYQLKNTDPAQCVDIDNNVVDLADVKDAILSILE